MTKKKKKKKKKWLGLLSLQQVRDGWAIFIFIFQLV